MRIAAPSILASVAPTRLDKDGQGFGRVPGYESEGAEGRFGYAIPNLLIEHAIRNTHVPVGFWRGVNTNQNAIWLVFFIVTKLPTRRPGPTSVPAQASG